MAANPGHDNVKYPDPGAGAVKRFSRGNIAPQATSQELLASLGGQGPPGGPTAAERKFAAKRHNEGVKVFATWMNTLSGVTIGAAAIIPAVKGMDAFVIEYRPVWFFLGLALHFVGQAALRLEMRSEE